MATKKVKTHARAAARKAPPKPAPKAASSAKSLGQSIRAAREARGMQQQELAKLLGWGKDRLSRIENGSRRLLAEDAERIRKLLQMDHLQWSAISEPGQSAPLGSAERYAPVPIIDRRGVTWAGKVPMLPTSGEQSIPLSWLDEHVEPKNLRIARADRDDPRMGDGEVLVFDTSATEVQRPGLFLLWSFNAVTIARCEPDLQANKVKVDRGPDATPALVDAKALKVIGRVVAAVRRL